MKIDGLWNGEHKITSYGNKLFYRDNPLDTFIQIRRAYFRDISQNPDASFEQFYQYDNTPPIINITSSDRNTNVETYILTGIATDVHSGIASVTINGQSVIVNSDGTFSKTYTLVEGINTFVAIATDGAGNTASANISVRYVKSDFTRTDLLAPKTESTYDNGSLYITTRVNSQREVYYHNYQAKNVGQGAGIDETFTLNIPKGVKMISISGWTTSGFQSPTGPNISIYDATTNTTLYSVTGQPTSNVNQAWTSGSYTLSEDITYTHDIKAKVYSNAFSYSPTWGGGAGGGFYSLTVNYYT